MDNTYLEMKHLNKENANTVLYYKSKSVFLQVYFLFPAYFLFIPAIPLYTRKNQIQEESHVIRR